MNNWKRFRSSSRRLGLRGDSNESNLGVRNMEEVWRTKISAGNQKKGNWYAFPTLKQHEPKRELKRKGFQWIWSQFETARIEAENQSSHSSKTRKRGQILRGKTKSKNLRTCQVRIWVSK